jgi:hypothetical protein
MKITKNKLLIVCVILCFVELIYILNLKIYLAYNNNFKKLPPDVALRIFYSTDVMEDQLSGNLIAAGEKVVPLVIKEVVRKDMIKRRYAIAALGIIGSVEALPVLEKIFRDITEQQYIRCDSLQAIQLINQDKANALSKETAVVSSNFCWLH